MKYPENDQDILLLHTYFEGTIPTEEIENVGNRIIQDPVFRDKAIYYQTYFNLMKAAEARINLDIVETHQSLPFFYNVNFWIIGSLSLFISLFVIFWAGKDENSKKYVIVQKKNKEIPIDTPKKYSPEEKSNKQNKETHRDSTVYTENPEKLKINGVDYTVYFDSEDVYGCYDYYAHILFTFNQTKNELQLDSLQMLISNYETDVQSLQILIGKQKNALDSLKKLIAQRENSFTSHNETSSPNLYKSRDSIQSLLGVNEQTFGKRKRLSGIQLEALQDDVKILRTTKLAKSTLKEYTTQCEIYKYARANWEDEFKDELNALASCAFILKKYCITLSQQYARATSRDIHNSSPDITLNQLTYKSSEAETQAFANKLTEDCKVLLKTETTKLAKIREEILNDIIKQLN